MEPLCLYCIHSPRSDLRYAEEPLQPGFVRTRRRRGPGPGEAQRILAIDCEMCVTEVGYELTRVAVLDMDYKVWCGVGVQVYCGAFMGRVACVCAKC